MCYYLKQKEDEIIKHQKVEDIKMSKSSKNESDRIKELGLTMEELKSIARKISIKNYENLSRIELVKEIDKLEQSKESKGKKIVSSLSLKGKKSIRFKPEKTSKKSIEIKHKNKNKRKQETVDKLKLKVKQLKKILANLKKMFTNQ